MTKIAFLTLHGIGVTPKDYADPLQRQLQSRVGAVWQDVAFESVYYQGIFQPKERAVLRRTLTSASIRQENLRKLALFGLADALGLESRKEIPGSAYELAQLALARKLLAARDQMGGNGPVVFLTHSLGCQVLSNYLHDAQQPSGRASAGIWRDIDANAVAIAGHSLSDEEREFLRGDTLQCWVSTGCNIPVFVAADTAMRIEPIRAPSPEFRWLNIYDPDDALAWPLRPLGGGYETLVDDLAINADKDPDALAWGLQHSHEAYWGNEQVLEPVAELLRHLAA